MSGPLRRAGRAVASVVGLVGLVAALPALLLTLVGNPLAGGLPTWAEAQTALADGWRPSDRFVVSVLALVLWALWAQLMGHLYAEVRAHRDRPEDGSGPVLPDVPRRRGPSRRLAGWLIGGIMVVGPFAPTAAFASPAPLPAVLVATQATTGPTPSQPAGVDVPAGPDMISEAAPAANPSTPAPEYVVHTWAESKDCLWNIAERFLGDPVRWHEIEDLNEDVAQPSGRKLGEDPRHWVYPGMVLRLPADATGPGLSVESAVSSVALAAPAKAPPPVRAPTGPPDQPAGVEATGWCFPGARARRCDPLPQTVAPQARLARTTPVPAPPAATVLSGPPSWAAGALVAAGPQDSAGHDTAGPRRALPAGPLLGVGGVVVAAGVAAEVRRRRRRQLARRRPHERLPELSFPAAAVARAVAYSPVEDVDWLGAELRLLVRRLGGAARARFEPTVVQYHGQQTIEVAMARSCGRPPEGWSGTAGSKVWTLETPSDMDELTKVAELPPCLPLLVSLGDQDEHGQVLLNLEASSAVGIVGDPGMVAALVRSLLWELAVSPLAERLTLLTLGVEAHDGEQMARWRPALDAEDMAATLRRDSAAVARSLGETGMASLTAARAEGEDSWPPTVAVVAAGHVTAELIEAAAGPGVVLVVAGGCPSDALEVHVAGGEVAIPSIGLVCVAQQLSEAVADGLRCLLAETTADPVPADRQVDEAVASADVVELREPWSPPAPRVLVRLLCPPAVEGAVRALTAQQLAGLAYLASHRRPTKGQVVSALWGDNAPGEKRWRDFLSELRSTMPDGLNVIPQVTDGVVATTDELGCDLDQLDWFLARAANHPEERVRCLEAATGLVRGVPFAHADPKARRFWRWVDVEHLGGRVFQQLAQAGYDLGRAHLDAGNPAAALQVANRLLPVCPLDPGLTEVLILAYEALGSPGAADSVFEAHDLAMIDACGYEGAGEATQLVIEQIRAARAGQTNGRRLTLVRD